MNKSSVKKIFILFIAIAAIGAGSIMMSHGVSAVGPSSQDGGGSGGGGGTPPTPPQPTRQLSVAITLNGGSGTGVGSVVGKTQSGTVIINCGTTGTKCSGGVGSGNITVTLTATPASGYQFSSWGGACSGTPNTSVCSLTWIVDDVYNAAVSADFTQAYQQPAPPSNNLTVQLTANGSGNNNAGIVTTVNSSAGVASISCGEGSTQCSTSLKFPPPQNITLTATPASGYTFSNWSGTGIALDSCYPVTNPTCRIINDTGSAASGTLTANFAKIVPPSPSFSGSMTANVVYASTTANQGTVYLSWPAAQNASSGTYVVSRDGTQIYTVSLGRFTATYYYDTKAPLNTAHVYSVTFKDGSGNTVGTVTSGSVNLNLKESLSGYAWANVNGTVTNGYFGSLGSSSFYGKPTTPFSVTGSASANSVTISVANPNDVWKGTIYRCSGYSSAFGCSGKTQIDSFNLNPGSTHTFTDGNLSSVTPYYYEVDGYGISAVWGLGQYFNAKTSGATYQGIGWVKFNSQTAPTDSSSSYGVYLDSSNNLVGYAWSGNGYGWLSFNAADFNDPSNAYPQAKLTGSTLSGYARFLAFENGNSSWDGYVNLSGVTFDPSTGNFGSLTPVSPVNILGQMSWCGSTYCVTTSSTTPLASNTWPQILPATNVQSNSFTVNWTNPQSYKKMEIHLFNTKDLNDPITNACADVASSTCYGSYSIPSNLQSTLSAMGTHAVNISGLNASTTYNVFVRGLLQ